MSRLVPALLLLSSSAMAAAPLKECKAHNFKAEFSCTETQVNPFSVQVGTCGKQQVASLYQSGVAGNTLVQQLKVSREGTAHPGMSATFKGSKFKLYINMTAENSKGQSPGELTFGSARKKLACTQPR
jgi:hypothetical protein